MLWLCLHFPSLSLEVVSRGGEPAEPLVISSGRGGRQWVLACSPQALALGLHTGMRLSAAYALAPRLLVKPRDETAEAAALEHVAAWAGRFTSTVSLVPPQGVLLEAAGSLLLFGGRDAFIQHVRQGLEELGYRASLALAPTPLGALLLARAGLEARVEDNASLRAQLARLPLQTLDLGQDTLAALQGLGLRCIGDCLRLPRDGLARRFGPGLLTCLDRVLGKAPDPRRAYVPPARFQGRLALPAEVESSAALLFAARRLMLELAGFLEARGGGVQQLTLELLHREHAPTRIALDLMSPSRDPHHLLELLRERLERVELPAPVRDLALSAGEILPLVHENRDLVDGRRREGDWGALVEKLRARLGAEAVRGIRVLAVHRPERAWELCAPGEQGSAADFGPRPLWLLAEPLPLRSEDGRPLLSSLSLEKGPERIESGWWDGQGVERDYFVAEARGASLWVFRERCGDRSWFLHGIFG
jgi:protein ImuB